MSSSQSTESNFDRNYSEGWGRNQGVRSFVSKTKFTIVDQMSLACMATCSRNRDSTLSLEWNSDLKLYNFDSASEFSSEEDGSTVTSNGEEGSTLSSTNEDQGSTQSAMNQFLVNLMHGGNQDTVWEARFDETRSSFVEPESGES